jgi:hypothetical protein
MGMQTCIPVVHEVVPALQGSPPGLHATLAAQLLQVPLRHTWFVPHAVPLEAGIPVSMHVAVPPEHAMVPWLQGLLGGGHEEPGVQGAHTPALL